MRIQRLFVRGLFGIFNHDIPLNMDERLTIIYGPNGYGKTLTLTLLDALFNTSYASYGDFFDIPFGEITVTLDTGATLSLHKENGSDGGMLSFSLTAPGSATRTFELGELTELTKKSIDAPDWLDDIKRRVNVRFVNTERLREFTDDIWPAISRSLSEKKEETQRKIALVEDILNSRLMHKRVSFTPEQGLIVTTVDGRELRPRHLSSGERHAVILMHELLFRVPDDSLVLIDEPELSLHIVWQQQFLRDISRLTALTAFDTLIATHSPQIIHDRWDLAVELKGPIDEAAPDAE